MACAPALLVAAVLACEMIMVLVLPAAAVRVRCAELGVGVVVGAAGRCDGVRKCGCDSVMSVWPY